MTGDTWTAEQLQTLREMSARGCKPRQISEALGGARTPGAVTAKLYGARRKPSAHGKGERPQAAGLRTTQWELEQQDRLRRARAAQSDLSALMGDPPPGFSAADRWRD
jgi:hypothetical protein